MESFKRYVTCIMAFFTPLNFVTLCNFYSNTSPVSFTKLYWETIEWEERRFFAYMAASPYMRITLYQQRQKITSLNTIEFLDTYVFINSPHWQSSGILIFLCKYYIVVSDTLVYSFLDALFLLLAIILSELREKPRRKDWVTEKST